MVSVNMNGMELFIQNIREVIPNQKELADQQFLFLRGVVKKPMFGKNIEIARRYYPRQFSRAFGSSTGIQAEANKITVELSRFPNSQAHFFAQVPETVRIGAAADRIMEAQEQGGMKTISLYEKDKEQTENSMLNQFDNACVAYPNKEIIPYLDVGQGELQPQLLTQKLLALNSRAKAKKVGLIYRGYATNVDNFLQVARIAAQLKYKLHMSGVPRKIGSSRIDGRQLVTLFGVASATRGHPWVTGEGALPRLRRRQLNYEAMTDQEKQNLSQTTGLNTDYALYQFTNYEAAEINAQSFQGLNGQTVAIIENFLRTHSLIVNTL